MPLASIREVALHQQNVLRDLCRLQVIEDAESGDRMRLRVRGHVDDTDRLFGSGILPQGTNGPHHRLGTDGGFSMCWARRRTKTFTLLDNRDHARAGVDKAPSESLAAVPEQVSPRLAHSARSTASAGRIQALVCSMEAS